MSTDFKDKAVHIDYTNHRGERRWRRIVPISGEFYFGKNEWHTESQWLFDALCLEKKDVRTFALKDVHKWEVLKEFRFLTPEEYEAKVAAGKKIVFSKDQGKSPRNQD